MYPSVRFQRASSDLESFTTVSKSDNSQKTQKENGHFSGEEAKEFYESLLKESTKTCSKRNRRCDKMGEKSENTVEKTKKIRGNVNRKPINIDFKNPRQVNVFLKMAQDGDIDGLGRFIKDNEVNIDATDPFGWTALMCAAKSGHKTCITLLLREGADTKLKNNQGQTAVDIAKQSGIQDVFDCRRRSGRKRRSDVSLEFESSFEQTCDTCKIKFFGSKHEHDTSTAHLFNCQYKSEKTFYHIPEDNIGFKLMKQKGWDQEKGLGPEGSGRKFPIKTVLKQDRRGLGNKSKKKAKITHFSACDTSAVESKESRKVGLRVPQQTSKKKLIQKQEQDRKWEHNLRVYMNTE